MNRFFLLVAITVMVLLALGCHHKLTPKTHCGYTLAEFKKAYNTDNFQMDYFPQDDHVQYLEKTDSSKKGFYRFDRNGMLTFYGFTTDDSTYAFGIEYDAMGRIKSRTGHEVAFWFNDQDGGDTVKMGFFLCSIGLSYGHVNVSVGIHRFENLTLYKALNYSNLVGATVLIRKPSKTKGTMMYVSGVEREDCKNIERIFTDSILLMPR